MTTCATVPSLHKICSAHHGGYTSLCGSGDQAAPGSAFSRMASAAAMASDSAIPDSRLSIRASGPLPDIEEGNVRPILDLASQGPGIPGEIDQGLLPVLGDAGTVRIAEPLQRVGFLARDPPRRFVRRGLQPDRDAVLLLEPRSQHIELQRADRAQDRP